MDSLYAKEVAFIHSLQKYFKHRDELILFFSHLGDPKIVFYFYFPFFFSLNKSLGLHIVWLTIFADWSNFMIKWILRGPRPFWWVFATNYYAKSSRIFPHLKHFPITCETGPGNPSGHVMVSTALYLGILEFILKAYPFYFVKPYGHHIQRIIGYMLIISIIVNIGLSRLYIAAHFPHQIFLGALGGILIWYVVTHLYKPETRTIRHNFIMCIIILISGLSLYAILYALDMHPDHSVAMAFKFCALRSFVNFNTNPLVSLTRTVGTHFGVTLASYASALLHRLNAKENFLNSPNDGRAIINESVTRSLEDESYDCHKRNGVYAAQKDRISSFSTWHPHAANERDGNHIERAPSVWPCAFKLLISILLSLGVGYLYFIMRNPPADQIILIYAFTFFKFSTFMLVIIIVIPTLVSYVDTLVNRLKIFTN